MDARADYYLLLIDIRGSTRLAMPKARQLMEKLEVELRRINRTLKPKPVLGLSMSYGDEVAGLFTTPARLFDVLMAVRNVLHPGVGLRFVVTRGKIAVSSKDIRKVGGEVFKKANEAMQRIKKRNRFCCWLLGEPIFDAVLTSLVEMSNALLEDMTQYQREVFILLEQGFAQKIVARKLKKHPQSVSDAVKRSKAGIVLDAHRAIRGLLLRLKQ